jgi:hypothetical protein
MVGCEQVGRGKLTFTAAIILIMFLSFNSEVGSADLPGYSVQSILGGDNTTLNPANSTADIEAQTSMSLFLNKVVSIDSDFGLVNFHSYVSLMPSSQKNMTRVNAMINSNQLFGKSIVIALVDGRVLLYDGPSGKPLNSSVNVDECLAVAKSAISNYEDAFNARYCEGFADIVPSTLESGNSTLTNENVSLIIQINTENAQQLQSVNFCWYKKVEGIKENALRVEVTVSGQKVLTAFLDYMAFFQVATSKVTVTQEQAIEIAKPYINEYATVNNRIISGISATLHFGNDINNSRDGERSLLFPEWEISAGFESANSYIIGYDVLLWGDNGNVSYATVAGVMDMPNNASFNPVYFIAATGSIIVTGTVLYAWCQRKKVGKRLF